MPKSDWNQRIRQEVAAIKADSGPESTLGCQADALKSLLNTIVDQITEADKRHTGALGQLQDRLSGLGEDARAMRARAPDDYQLGLERIEAGMAELAARLRDMNGDRGSALDAAAADHSEEIGETVKQSHSSSDHAVGYPATAAHAAPAENHEPPVALRSAQSLEATTKRREAGPAKGPAGIDTFDVIESLPGNASDPWDPDAADALANVYSADIPAFEDDQAYTGSAPQSTPRVYAPAAHGGVPDMQGAPADLSWLDQRLGEIAERLEASIADVRTDQSFFALGQRIDQIEHSFADALDNVATRSDFESVRLIEQHMSELVMHLENTHLQMTRLETIENQLAAVASRIDEAPQLAVAGGGVAFDVDAAVKAAAEETASRFAAAPAQLAGLDEMQSLIERSMTQARQSEENTTALLDTLQQAMIRLLDRMDAIEINQHQEPEVVPPVAFGRMERQPRGERHDPRFEPEREFAAHAAAPDRSSIDAVAAAVAVESAARGGRAQQRPAEHLRETHDDEQDMHMRSQPRQGARPSPASEAERNPDKMRQDFIADARRAKLRLTSEEGSDQIVLTSAATPLSVEDLPPSQRPAGKVAKSGAKDKSAPILTPRVAALAIALVVAGGAWMFMPGKKGQQAGVAAPPAVNKEVKPATQSSEAAPKKAAPEAAAGKPAAKPAKPAANGDAPPPDANFQKRSGDPQISPDLANSVQTEGRIVSGEVATGETQIPLAGVAVATTDNVSAVDVARAHRQNAIASVSSRLGQAAGDIATQALPTAFVPDQQAATPSTAPTAPRATSVAATTSGGALDLPPATVGPLSLRLAAANGDPSAEFEVGARLAEGKGTDQNFKEAAKWYQRAASKGFIQAQYRLGTLYERGLGLKADEERAKDWYQRAAEQGNVKAMHNLAVLSANSRKGAPDYALASKYFSDAAEHGLPDSQFNLAVLYENGLGVTGDMRQAYKWLYLAARNGDKEAVRRRDILKGKLTADELSQSEEMIRSYQPRASDPMANDARTAGESWKRNPVNGQSG